MFGLVWIWREKEEETGIPSTHLGVLLSPLPSDRFRVFVIVSMMVFCLQD
jgi:hypothetical protein